MRYDNLEPVHEELYDLENDEDKQQNLVASKEHAEQLKALRTRWRALRTALR